LLQYRDPAGTLQYIKDPRGNVVLSRLNEELLHQIAHEGAGLYIPLRAPNAVEVLAERGLAQLARSDQATRLVRHFNEKFQWPLALAIVLLLVEPFVSERRRASRRSASSTVLGPQRAVATLALAVFLIPTQLLASPGRALRHYEAGRFDDAAAAYQDLLEQRGDDPRLQYNLGNAAYRRGDFAAAVRAFNESTTAPDLDLQQRAYYNLGNALFRLGQQFGEDPARFEPWREAVQSYKAALQLRPDDEDAAFNLEFVQQQLEALPPQPEPSPSPPEDAPDDSEQPDGPQDQSSEPDPDSADDTSSSTRPDPTSGSAQQDSDPGDSPPQPDPEESEPDDSQTSDSDAQGQEPDPAPTSAGGPMTLEEARQLLDASSQEERTMTFAPQQPPGSPAAPLKDW
jgi:Ca-activated chloride channel homolog